MNLSGEVCATTQAHYLRPRTLIIYGWLHGEGCRTSDTYENGRCCYFNVSFTYNNYWKSTQMTMADDEAELTFYTTLDLGDQYRLQNRSYSSSSII